MKRRTILWIIAALIFALVLLIACGGILTSIADENADAASGRPVTLVQPKSSTTEPARATTKASPAAPTLTKKTIALTVKTTDKSCFGSAGCNVQYEIRAAIVPGTTPGDCDVTYEVRGLDDPQIGTLHVTPTGRYTQDSYQAGQTPRSSSKLTAVVTDIECE